MPRLTPRGKLLAFERPRLPVLDRWVCGTCDRNACAALSLFFGRTQIDRLAVSTIPAPYPLCTGDQKMDPYGRTRASFPLLLRDGS